MITCGSVLSRAASMLASAVAVLVAGGSTARANPANLVPSAGVPGEPVLFNVAVDYEYQIDSSVVARENAGAPDADPLGGPPLSRELEFKQTRHVLTPRAEFGVFRDTWLSVALPIVLGQKREIEVIRGVDPNGLTTVADGILPAGGFDAHDPTTAPPGDLMFRGATRAGLDQLHLGLGIAPMNQRRDSTKPTWKLGAEVRLSIGNVMRFDARDPGAETGVSSGVHELRLWTTVDRRIGWAEGWFEVFWQAPIGTREESLFQDPGFGVTNDKLAQRGGVRFGLEASLLDDAQTGNRLSLDLGARVIGHFEGRGYSELWEVFALAGDSRGTGPLILDRDPTDPGLQAMSHPGITNIENYLETGGRLALRAQLGRHVRFAATVDVAWKTEHLITFADAGIDLPSCSTGRSPCENANNDLVNPGTREVNPLHAPLVDLVGHRYLSTDNFGLTFGVEAQALF